MELIITETTNPYFLDMLLTCFNGTSTLELFWKDVTFEQVGEIFLDSVKICDEFKND